MLITFSIATKSLFCWIGSGINFGSGISIFFNFLIPSKDDVASEWLKITKIYTNYIKSPLVSNTKWMLVLYKNTVQTQYDTRVRRQNAHGKTRVQGCSYTLRQNADAAQNPLLRKCNPRGWRYIYPEAMGKRIFDDWKMLYSTKPLILYCLTW